MQKFTQSVYVGSPVQPLVPPGINTMHSDAKAAGLVRSHYATNRCRLTFDLKLGANSKTPPPFFYVLSQCLPL